MRTFLLLLALFSGPHAARADGFYLGLGASAQNLLKVAEAPSGGRRLLGTIYAPEWQLGWRRGPWFPLAAVSFPGSRSEDGALRRYLLRLQLPYLFSAEGSPWELKAGAGLQLLLLQGRGGTRELSINGVSETVYAPEGTRLARWLYLLGGVGFVPGHGPWRFDLDLQLASPLSGKRALGLALGGGYVF